MLLLNMIFNIFKSFIENFNVCGVHKCLCFKLCIIYEYRVTHIPAYFTFLSSVKQFVGNDNYTNCKYRLSLITQIYVII
jgi:hypothetical protein